MSFLQSSILSPTLSRPELKSLFQLFSTTLLDPESNTVRMTTLRGLAKVAEYISTDDKHDIKAFQDLIMPMLKVTQQAITEDDDEGVKHAYDVFGDVAHFGYSARLQTCGRAYSVFPRSV